MLLHQISGLRTHEARTSWPEAETVSDDVGIPHIQRESTYKIGGIQGGRKECEAICISPRHTVGQTELARVRTL